MVPGLRRTLLLIAVTLGTPPNEPVRVTVSRREVRVVFPRDTTRGWGWSDRKDPEYYPVYEWGVMVEGMDGPRALVARVFRENDEARQFASLEGLVSSSRGDLCSPGMMWQCASSGVGATVDAGRVVLTFRDSAQIARLFGMRPAVVDAWQSRPGGEGRSSRDSIRVEYIEPQVPLPDSATRDDAARSRLRYEASISLVSRYINQGVGPLRLRVGDSTAVYVSEMRCRHDVCTTGSTPLDSGWTVTDTSVARLQLVPPDSTDGHTVFIFGGRPLYLKALRPGRTTLRVRGLHSGLDSAPSSEPPARELEREIIVAPWEQPKGPGT